MGKPRRPPQPGGSGWRSRREPVPASPDDLGGFWDKDGDGSAGVREPRRPRPLGPMSAAGEALPPAEPLFARLGDPRY